MILSGVRNLCRCYDPYLETASGIDMFADYFVAAMSGFSFDLISLAFHFHDRLQRAFGRDSGMQASFGKSRPEWNRT